MPSDLPELSPAPPRRRSCLTSTLALVALMGASTLLLMLPIGLIGEVFVIGGVASLGLFGFHYLVWGRLLNLELKDSEHSSDDKTK